MGKNYFVTRRGDRWALVRQDAERASGFFDTQREALERGRELAKESKGELHVQGRDGRFRDSDSFGNDPNPPKDRKH